MKFRAAIYTNNGPRYTPDASAVANDQASAARPQPFTIDADGALQEERVGDASLEGKSKKLLARAHEMQLVEKLNSSSASCAACC